MGRTTGQRGLEQLRTWRNRPERDLTLAEPLAREVKLIRRLERSMGSIATAWQDLVPADVASRTALVGVSRGVLTVRVSDSAARYELDRWLRTGGETAIIRRCVNGLTRIRLV